MERQKDLIEMSPKDDQLNLLYKNLKYNKLITFFGNVESKVMIIGLAPVQSHIDSDSKSCFKFDIDLNQDNKSGGVLIKIFKEFNLKITDFFWNNVYKIPIESITEYTEYTIFHEILEKEISLINPTKIICLGSDSFKVVKNLNIGVNINIIKVFHPAYLLRNAITFDEMLINYKFALL